MKSKKLKLAIISWLLSTLFFVCGASHADELVAIVEDCSPSLSGVDVFEYLSPGTIFKLADNEWILLGYFRSCNQETINGGTILVGENKSTVIDGSVNRRKVQCDSENLQLTTDQLDRAGVTVMRKGEGQIEVSMIIHSTSPLFHVTTSAATLEVASLDQPGKPLIFDVEKHRVDFAKHGVTLRGGGLYSAKTVDREVVFRIDKFSRPGSSALLSRLIPL